MADNRDISNRASETLDFHAKMTEDQEDVLVDILVDLMHYCDQTSQDFNDALYMAKVHFDSEE